MEVVTDEKMEEIVTLTKGNPPSTSLYTHYDLASHALFACDNWVADNLGRNFCQFQYGKGAIDSLTIFSNQFSAIVVL